MSVNIVLVEPQIPQNTGNIARTCACTGARMHLVEPMGFKIEDKKLKRAGLDYWNKLDISYYKCLDDFFEKNSGEYRFFTTKAQKAHSEVSYSKNTYLIFGREDKGLPENLLRQNAENCIRLPMRDELRSLNLSNAVAVGVYEALRCQGYPGMAQAKLAF